MERVIKPGPEPKVGQVFGVDGRLMRVKAVEGNTGDRWHVIGIDGRRYIVRETGPGSGSVRGEVVE